MAVLTGEFFETARKQIADVREAEQKRGDEQLHRKLNLQRAQNALDQKAAPLITLLDELKTSLPALAYEVTPDEHASDPESISLRVNIEHHQSDGSLRICIADQDGNRRPFVREIAGGENGYKRIPVRNILNESRECICYDGLEIFIDKRGIFATPQDHGKLTGDRDEGHHFKHETIQIRNGHEMQRVVAQWIGRIAPESIELLQNLTQTDSPSKWERFRDRLTHFHI